MKRNALSILNGFKNVQNSTFNEILKGVIDPSKVNNEKFDIFSKRQVKKYLDNILENNIGLAKEIQKGVVEETKSELGKLIPVNIKKGSRIEKFYITKKGDCTELLKAIEPVNNQEDYFENDDEFNEEEILNYIRDNQPDDDKLVNEFGDGIIDFINKLHEDGKIDVSDDGFYLLKESSDDEGDNGNDEDNEEGGDEGNEENQEESDENNEGGDDNGDENQEEGNNDNGEGEEGNGENDNKEGEEGDGNISSEGMGLNGEELNLDNEDSQEGEENNNGDDLQGDNQGDENNIDTNGNVEEGAQEGDNNNGDDINNEGGDEGNEGDNGDDLQGGEGNEEGIIDNNIEENNEGDNGEGDDNLNDNKEYTPEELEKFAKKTATATLIKFYKNSEDENLKDVVAIELKTRGIDIASEAESNEKMGDNDLPNNKAELDELESWTKNYLGSYDKEDLVKFVADLANQSPAKRKELKEAYRKYYSSSNNGNQALKVDEKDFKDFLENHYFNNFTDGDLQSMAFLLVSKNPKEYKKFKSMYEEEKNPLI